MNIIKKLFFQTILVFFSMDNIVYASQSDDTSIGSVVFRMIAYIAIIVLVLFLTKYVTKAFAKSSNRLVKSKYIKIVDVLNLGTNIKLLIVELNDFIYFLTMTNNSIDLVDKFSKEETNFDEEFEDHLSKYRGNFEVNKKNFNSISKKIQSTINSFNKNEDEEEQNDDKEYNEENY